MLSFFSTYPAGVDFILYLFVFTVACRRAAAKKLPGRNGHAIATVVGIVLAIALSAAETALGFNVRPFGPIAATIALILLVWHRTVQGRVLASPAAQGTHPAQERETDSLSPDVISAAGKIASSEKRLVKPRLRDLTGKGQRECRKTIDLLQAAIAALRKPGAPTRAPKIVKRALHAVSEHERELLLALLHVRQVDRRLLRFDLSEYHSIQQRYNSLPRKQQQRCRRLFAEEREKLGVEREISRSAHQGEKVIQQSELCVAGAKQDASVGSSTGAAMWLERALDEVHRALDLCERLRRLERRLLKLLEKQLGELESAPES